MSTQEQGGDVAAPASVRRVALMGNPNTGKTSLFNAISGLRHKTSNFPGTTLEARVARVRAGAEGGCDADLIDLPGIYSLELDQLESRVSRDVLAGTAAPRGEPMGSPECVVVVVDASNLPRNLMMVGEVLRRRLPTVIALNMVDVASAKGIDIKPEKLGAMLGCKVVGTNARTGDGVDELRIAIREARIPTPTHPVPGTPEGLRAWAEDVANDSVLGDAPVRDTLDETTSDRVDRVLLNPVLGVLVFAAVMAGVFFTIFSLAHLPMGWIETIFGWGTELVKRVLPEGALRDLVADGIVGGVGSTVIFLPQICLLFFLIALLEDTGYLARGAFLMDRLLRPFGLPGHSFVPLLSSHACALPGIMSARAIPDMKERLATILVAPFMTCSARLPVYVLLTTLLFKDSPLKAALAFIGCYLLGILAGVLSALIARRTFLKGKSRAMALELPSYKWPNLRTAFIGTIDRGWLFLKNAGTVILAICIVLWWLGAYPHVQPPAQATQMREVVQRAEASGKLATDAVALEPAIVSTRLRATAAAGGSAEGTYVLADIAAEADRLEASHQTANSFMGRIGRAVQPVFAPLGFDWQLTVGVMASFAAREVFVSTMNIVIAGQGEAADAAEEQRLMEQIQTSKRSDGVTPVFTPAVSWALLVFFVLAMQCLPTLAVTAREAGGAKWAVLQLVWMSAVAYAAALVTYLLASSF